MTVDEHKALGEAGFIPGPDESKSDFVKRLDTLKSLNMNTCLLPKKEEYEPLTCDFHGLGAEPKWIPLVYSNRRLLPWQGAVSWIITTPEGIPFPLVQLRKGFKKGHFLFNDRDEVLRHEAVHAMRLVFNEPRFEEILAYFHSKKKWRRLLGPLFRKPSQAFFFISLIFISLAMQATALFFYNSPYLPFIKSATFLPFIDLFFRFTLLIKDRRILRKALQTLQNLFPKQKDPFAVALRLKDAEIQLFATKPFKELLLYIKEKSFSSLRWQQILAQFS